MKYIRPTKVLAGIAFLLYLAGLALIIYIVMTVDSAK